MPQTLTAQDAAPDPPARPTQAERDRPDLLSLRRLDAALEFDSEFETRRVRTARPGPFRAAHQDNRRLSLDGQFIVDVDASIYDPDLLSLSGTIGLGLTHERFFESLGRDSLRDTNDGYLSTYDLQAEFLRTKRLSGSAYAARSRNRYSRPFLPSLREEREEAGAALHWTHEVFPMQLTFDHRNLEREGSRRLRDDESLDEDILRYDATLISSAQHSLGLQYEYDRTEERYSGSRFRFHNERHQVRLHDQVLFGETNQHRMETVARFQDEQGAYARDLVEIGPRLSLHHSDSLTTQYQYQFAREQIGRLDIDRHRADWQLIHQVYENLTSTYSVFGLKEDVEGDAETDEIGAAADWSYTRANPLGRFSANLSLATEWERTRGGGLRAVFAESAAFIDPLPVTLSRPNAIPWTIVVRDASRGRVFRRGLDYFVTPWRDRVLLLRNPLGAIADRQTVSIDYLYSADQDGSRDTQLANLSLQQDFDNGLTPYYRLDFRRDDRTLPSRLFRYNDFEQNRHRLGLRWRRPRYALGAELELLKDPIAPYRAYRLFGTANLLRQAARSIDLRADLSHYFFDQRDRGDSVVVQVSLDARAQLARSVDGYLTQSYRYEDDGTRGRGIIRGIDLEAGLSCRWGLFVLTASVEYDLLTIVDSREDGLGVWLKVRREFPDLLAAAR